MQADEQIGPTPVGQRGPVLQFNELVPRASQNNFEARRTHLLFKFFGQQQGISLLQKCPRCATRIFPAMAGIKADSPGGFSGAIGVGKQYGTDRC